MTHGASQSKRPPGSGEISGVTQGTMGAHTQALIMQNLEKPLMGSRLRVAKFFALVGQSWELLRDRGDPLLRRSQNVIETPPDERFPLGFKF